jgi:hypothetical protein
MGSGTPYSYTLEPCFGITRLIQVIKGALSDAIVILSSLNVIAGELDA